jgi:4-hydroxybenzoate polyprenyltransferase
MRPIAEAKQAGTVVPARRRAARLALYLGQMFPLQQMLPYALFHFFAIWFTLQALSGALVVQITWTSVRGAATVMLFLLLMRLYDELKDAATDIALGRSGDPLYRDRVLVTGAVRLEDVKWLRWAVTAALIALNLWPARGWGAFAFWIVFAVTWFSFNWFFWPPMSRYLLVAFLTHNPISLLLGAYVAALFADRFGSDRIAASAIPLLVGLWLPLATWETSRKVRAPTDETSYQTYSRVLGWKTAAVVPAVFAIGSTVALAIVARDAGLSLVFSAAIVAACGVVAIQCVRFRLAPSRQSADLKPWANLYATTANAGLVAAVLASKDVTW